MQRQLDAKACAAVRVVARADAAAKHDLIGIDDRADRKRRHRQQARGRVECVGFVSDDRLLDLYATALAYIHPSSFEGFSLTLLEAMQCGTPVFAPAGSSNAEAAGDGAYGSSATAASALRTILQDRGEWELASASAWERGQLFQWHRCAAAIAAKMAAAT